ncbi:hypothetical protein CR513_34090, partial [Mucuna pruriens]
MCDASNSALRVVLGQRVDKQPYVIAYASRTMDLDKKDAKNVVANHLSQLERGVDPLSIRDEFPDEQILQLEKGASGVYKEKLESDAKYYIWDDPYLRRLYNDQVIRRCILDLEIQSVLHFCHSASEGSYYGWSQIDRKVLDYGFY